MLICTFCGRSVNRLPVGERACRNWQHSAAAGWQHCWHGGDKYAGLPAGASDADHEAVAVLVEAMDIHGRGAGCSVCPGCGAMCARHYRLSIGPEPGLVIQGAACDAKCAWKAYRCQTLAAVRALANGGRR